MHCLLPMDLVVGPHGSQLTVACSSWLFHACHYTIRTRGLYTADKVSTHTPQSWCARGHLQQTVCVGNAESAGAQEESAAAPRPVRFPAALILDQLRAGSLQQTQYKSLHCLAGKGGVELFLAGLQANELRGYTGTNIFVHCTLYTV